jgi:hypothetical protein
MCVAKMSTKTIDARPGVNTLLDEALEVTLSMMYQL